MIPLSSQHAGVGRALAALLCLTGLAQSCSTGPGEGEDSCLAGVDADGDGQSGCADSDCHRFELCRKGLPLGGEDTAPTGGRSGQGGSGGVTPPAGGMSGGAVSPAGSGGSDPEEDAGAEPDAGRCMCGTDELCTDAGCIPITTAEPRYVIELNSAESPIGTPGPPPHGVCVEFACQGAGSPLGYCPCQPEPYVRVIHITSPLLDPIETVVLTTQVQGTALTVTFGDTERAEVPLKPGDGLRFELWDDNVTTDDTAIYSCPPPLDEALAMLSETRKSAPLSCSTFSGALAAQEFFIHATLIVE